MPRKKTDGWWEHLVYEMVGGSPRPSAAQIEVRLKRVGAQEGREDYPKTRTIGRLLEKYDGMTDLERQFYGEFRWPQAMVSELIPWEATRLALDVLAYYLRKHKARPSVRRILWHWRLSLVNPGWEIGHRDVYVTLVSAAEASGRPIWILDSTDSTNGIDGAWTSLGELSPHELDLFLMSEPWKDDIQDSRQYTWEKEGDDEERE